MTGVVVGGLVAGLSVYIWLDEEQLTQSPRLSESFVTTLRDRTSSPPTNIREVRSDDLASHLNIQSIRESVALRSDFDQNASLYLLLAHADEADLESYISESLAIPSSDQRIGVLPTIFGRYAALNPREALDRVLALDQLTSRERTFVLRSLFREWTVSDLEGAIAALDSLPDAYKFTAATAIMSRNDHLSTDQQIQLAQEIGPSEQWINNTLASIRSEAAKNDPRSAFYELIRDTTHLQYARHELIPIVARWFELEGAKVLSEIDDSIEDRITKRFLLQILVGSWFDSDNVSVIEMMRVISEFPNRKDAKELMEQLLRSSSRSDPKRAFEYSFEFGDQFINREVRKRLLRIWAIRDAEGLLSEANSLPREYQDVAVVTALGRMSTTSPEEAIQIARSLARPGLQRQARDEIVKQWSSVNAKDALEWLINDGFNIGDQNDTAIFSQALSSYLNQDLDAAQNFVSDYRGVLKNQFVETVVRHLINVDVDHAIDYMPNVVKEHRSALQLDIGRRLAEGEPLKALSFGTTIEQSNRDQYYDTMLNAWAQNNFFSLHENIQRVPAEYRTHAAEAILRHDESENTLSNREIQNLKAMVTRRTRVFTDGGVTISISGSLNSSDQ